MYSDFPAWLGWLRLPRFMDTLYGSKQVWVSNWKWNHPHWWLRLKLSLNLLQVSGVMHCAAVNIKINKSDTRDWLCKVDESPANWLIHGSSRIETGKAATSRRSPSKRGAKCIISLRCISAKLEKSCTEVISQNQSPPLLCDIDHNKLWGGEAI